MKRSEISLFSAFCIFQLFYQNKSFRTVELTIRTHPFYRSSSFDNLRFLSVDQAIADIAVLISTLRDHLSSDFPRVIVWGTGYGATLVNLTLNFIEEFSNNLKKTNNLGNVCPQEISSPYRRCFRFKWFVQSRSV